MHTKTHPFLTDTSTHHHRSHISSSTISCRNSISVEGPEKNDAVKSQAIFLVKVKSQGPFFILTGVAAQSTESMVVPPPCIKYYRT